MSIRHYTNTATEATLNGGITSTDLSFSLTSFSDYPAAPFAAAIGRGEADEEIVLVTAVSGSTVTVARGHDGTTAKSHSAGASFLHVAIARDYQEANDHTNASSGVHGAISAVVGVSDTQTLTNKTLVSPVLQSAVLSGTTTLATTHITGTLTLDSALVIAGAVTASGGLAVPVGQPTTVGPLTATTGHLTGAATIDGNATVGGTLGVAGAATVASATASGLVKGTPLESGGELTLAPIAAPTGVTGKSKVWTQSDGGIYARVGTATAVGRIVEHWGSGTTYPTAALAGDEFFHTGLGCTMRWNGTSFRQAEAAIVANDAAKLAISATYPTALHAGFTVWATDTGRTWEWTGTFWRLLSGKPYAKVYRNTNGFIGTNVSYPIVFDAKDSDPWNAYNGTMFVAPLTGRYLVSGTIGYAAQGAVADQIRGALVATSIDNGTTFQPSTGSAQVALNVGGGASTVVSVAATEVSLSVGQGVVLMGFTSSPGGSTIVGAATGAASNAAAMTVQLVEQTA